MREYLIAGNWKMNKTPSEAVALAKEILPLVKDSDNKVMIAPSFVCIPAVAEVIKGSNIILAAQNMATVTEGAHTGETSVLMLKDLGVDVVILGHSERRHIYGETNEMINEKVKLALANGLKVDLCIGELLEEREAGKAEDVCFEQLEKGLAVCPKRIWPMCLSHTNRYGLSELVKLPLPMMLKQSMRPAVKNWPICLAKKPHRRSISSTAVPLSPAM